MEAREKAIKAAEALNDRKARNLLILDVAGATIITEFMVICTAANAQHVNTLCDDVEDKLAEQGIVLKKKEGQREGRWAILDYGDVLVHIFHPEEREYYRLERLWDEGTNHVELPFERSDAATSFMDEKV